MKNHINLKPLLLFIILFSNIVAATDKVPSSFIEYVPYMLGDESDFGTLYLAPELSKIISRKHSKIKYYSELGVVYKKNKIQVYFDPGPSDDPTFIIQINNYKEISYITGDVIYLSATGIFYSKTGSDDYFEKAKKYIIHKNKLEEVKQPFYFVNMECKTSTAMNMYTERCEQGHKVATLPKNSNLKILLAEFDYSKCNKTSSAERDLVEPPLQFLVASPFGLVGWVSSTAGDIQRQGTPLSCIRFAGD